MRSISVCSPTQRIDVDEVLGTIYIPSAYLSTSGDICTYAIKTEISCACSCVYELFNLKHRFRNRKQTSGCDAKETIAMIQHPIKADFCSATKRGVSLSFLFFLVLISLPYLTICILGNFTSFFVCRVESNILDPDMCQNCLKVTNDATSGERFFYLA